MLTTTFDVKFIKPASVRRVIEDFIPRDRIFTVVFRRKSDGELRTMNCRRGVQQGLTGVGRKSPADVITVFDLKKNDYRAFRIDSVVEIRTDGLIIQAS